MSDEVRAFFAIELPTEARASAIEAVERLKSVARHGVRWMALDTLHLTLKFLGEIREDDVPRRRLVLQDAHHVRRTPLGFDRRELRFHQEATPG